MFYIKHIWGTSWLISPKWHANVTLWVHAVQHIKATERHSLQQTHSTCTAVVSCFMLFIVLCELINTVFEYLGLLYVLEAGTPIRSQLSQTQLGQLISDWHALQCSMWFLSSCSKHDRDILGVALQVLFRISRFSCCMWWQQDTYLMLCAWQSKGTICILRMRTVVNIIWKASSKPRSADQHCLYICVSVGLDVVHFARHS